MLRAGHDASLEYYPAVTIPFPGSALVQTVQVTAAPTSRIAGDRDLGDGPRGARRIPAVPIALEPHHAVGGRTADLRGRHAPRAGRHRRRECRACWPAGAYVAAGFWHGATVEAGTPPAPSAVEDPSPAARSPPSPSPRRTSPTCAPLGTMGRRWTRSCDGRSSRCRRVGAFQPSTWIASAAKLTHGP